MLRPKDFFKKGIRGKLFTWHNTLCACILYFLGEHCGSLPERHSRAGSEPQRTQREIIKYEELIAWI